MKLWQRLKGMRVTEQLAELFQTKGRDEQGAMLEALEHYVGEFRRVEREQRPSTGARAFATHEAMTVWIAQAVARPPGGAVVQCRRGCASCCRLLITVFPDEAALALDAAREAGLELDRDRLHRQAAARTVGAWRALSREDRTCVFLQGDECGIYEHRPSACRKYAVASPRELCDTDQHPGTEVAMVVSGMAEIITSAAVTVWGEAPFAAAVLKALA